jgi:hypothetical protein
MTDEKLITDFLEKNYRVITDDVYFKVAEKDSYKRITPNEFLDTFKTIFGDFTTLDNETSIELFQKWFSFHKRLLTKKLTEYLDTLDMSEGSVKLLFKAVNRFGHGQDKGLYNGGFIENYFNDYYKETVIDPLLKKILKSFHVEAGSNALIETISEKINHETPKIYQYALNHLNEWYANTVIGDKMKDFLTQLVITLGTRNWVVTWIGHGPLSREKLLSQFKDENEYHHKFIVKMYDEWYETAVIDASERTLMRNNYGNTFPGVNLPSNF